MEIKQASLHDVDQVIALIQKRILWMDEKNLYQWNKTGYLDSYPYTYFEKIIKENTLFIAVQNGVVVGAIALFKHDIQWVNDVKALYIHHLVTDPRIPGIGKSLMFFAEEYAQKHHIGVLRLDSQKGNIALNKYYDSLGYEIVGQCEEGMYIGNKREKVIALKEEFEND